MAASRAAVALLLAAISFTSVLAASANNNRGYDHRTHAVPGGPYISPDMDSDGKALVTMNGELSHSHYFNSKTGATGKILRYKWRIGETVLCASKICKHKFPLGRSVVSLDVVDNTGSSASANTVVNVYKGASSGVRLWFYPGKGQISEKLGAGLKPSYSATSTMINLRQAAFPSFAHQTKFSMRILGKIRMFKTGQYRFRVRCGEGTCSLWVGTKRVLRGSDKVIDSRPTFYSSGLREIRGLYRRKHSAGKAPKFTLSWKLPGSGGWNLVPAKYFSHDPSVYTPVVNSVKPANAAVGGVITIYGTSLLNVKSVKIGNLQCAGPVSKNQYVVKCIVPGGKGKQKLRVQTEKGQSNKVDIVIDSVSTETGGSGSVGYYQPIKFVKTFLKMKGKVWKAPQLTAITLGPDNKYYIGSLSGVVHVLQTSFGNEVTSYCKSTKLGESRSILGVAFNPAETNKLRLYASTSVLYWAKKQLLPLTKGWHNGQVIAMQRTKSACLTKVETVISGLPVSNYDHSVNGITFDEFGQLLVTVGGTTNGGVSKKDDGLGGVADSPLSGSMLWAPILKKGFNGNIKYSQYDRPDKANQISGDVHVYAAGLRNSVCHVAHSNGHIYATDNGPNAKFGARSTSCGSETTETTEPDKLKVVKRGAYLGYANRNRGRKDKRQCATSSVTKAGTQARLESSTNGIVEYTANTFGGQLRGDLMLSKFAVSGAGRTFRARLNSKGEISSVFELASFSGLTAALSGVGAMVMPRVFQGVVAALLPIEKDPHRLVVTSVMPFRGPRRGGNIITVTGWGLRPPLRAMVGGRRCGNVGNFKKGRSFTCSVPRGKGKAAVVVERFGKASHSFGYEYVYLHV